MAERLYTAGQVAALLGMSAATVDDWIGRAWLQVERLPGGTVCVSETGLAQFLSDRGVDLRAILAEALSLEAKRNSEDGLEARRAESAPVATRTEPPPPSPADDPPTRVVKAILADALQRGASAIYLEPQRDGLTLRLCVDGVVREKPHFKRRLPKALRSILITEAKMMAGLDITDARPQQGRLSIVLAGARSVFRVATGRTAFGEQVVIVPEAADPRCGGGV